jgi:nuclear pore complex protein Nup98-Nup96
MGGPPGGNIFGNSLGLGSFTGSTAQPGQGTLTASISQPIAHNLPIFAMLPPGPQSIDLTPRRKPTIWKDIPTRDPVPSFGLTYRPLQVQPRGYALLPAAEASKIFFSDGKPGALDLTKITEKRPPSVLGPDLFFGKSAADALAASAKPSVKKLVLTKKVDPSELYKKITNPNFKHSVSFSPALGMAVREREAALQLRKIGSTATVKTPSKSDAKDKDAPSKPVDPSELDEGEYWSKPDLDSLKGLDTAALSSLKDLVVGRAGYGEIHFLEPVDLTGVSKLGTLLGKIIRFDDRECSVYPDFDDEDKPPIGTGLNVKARIILVRCWTLDKATREPIKDEKHPAAIKHLKKLKNMKDTTFEGFDIVEGKWTFTVEHF